MYVRIETMTQRYYVIVLKNIIKSWQRLKQKTNKTKKARKKALVVIY